MVTILVAYDENRVIGNKGQLPWHIPQDLANFKATTTGHVVIMGRKTWDSLPEKFKPLPNRVNVVITSTPEKFQCKGVAFEDSLEDAIDYAEAAFPHKDVFIIGGAQIYKYAIDNKLADRVIASEVHGCHEGDAFFPELPNQGVELVKSHKLLAKFDGFERTAAFDLVEYVL